MQSSPLKLKQSERIKGTDTNKIGVRKEYIKFFLR